MRGTGLPVPSVLITADDVTHGKPDPEAYLLAAAKLGVRPSRCVVVEDAPPGIKAGQAAGMRVVAVVTTHSRHELVEADVVVARLVGIQIVTKDNQPGGRLLVRVVQTPSRRDPTRW